MTPALIGRKVGMTRIYDDKGAVVPVTVVEAGPCAVTQVKTTETDGYHAVQLGFRDIKAKFSTFGLIGHAAKAGSDRKSTRLNSSHLGISYAVFCLKKKTKRSKQQEIK